jgi:hypothetical protein
MSSRYSRGKGAYWALRSSGDSKFSLLSLSIDSSLSKASFSA